ncbi:hypothetical protein MP228_012283 [Amoeboaphelidium protococcarum]|nr:hypothetical protein MP228_012283 [Amoeboaphelidium protococcarum]
MLHNNKAKQIQALNLNSPSQRVNIQSANVPNKKFSLQLPEPVNMVNDDQTDSVNDLVDGDDDCGGGDQLETVDKAFGAEADQDTAQQQIIPQLSGDGIDQLQDDIDFAEQFVFQNDSDGYLDEDGVTGDYPIDQSDSDSNEHLQQDYDLPHMPGDKIPAKDNWIKEINLADLVSREDAISGKRTREIEMQNYQSQQQQAGKRPKQSGFDVTANQIRKHNIQYLAHQAVLNEEELNRRFREQRQKKARGRSKYGY